RYLNLNEDIAVGQTSTLLANGLAAFPPNFLLRQGAAITLVDTFAVSNNFYGGQIGIRSQYDFERFFINGFAKLALGVTEQTTRIQGTSTAVTPVGVRTVSGGLL